MWLVDVCASKKSQKMERAGRESKKRKARITCDVTNDKYQKLKWIIWRGWLAVVYLHRDTAAMCSWKLKHCSVFLRGHVHFAKRIAKMVFLWCSGHSANCWIYAGLNCSVVENRIRMHLSATDVHPFPETQANAASNCCKFALWCAHKNGKGIAHVTSSTAGETRELMITNYYLSVLCARFWMPVNEDWALKIRDK